MVAGPRSTEFLRLAPGASRRAAVARAAEILREGGVAALPTETVYGLAVDAADPDALARLRAVKERGPDKPFQLLVGTPADVERLAAPPGRTARKLMRTCWPGPLTLVLPAAEGIDARLTDATAAPPTVGLRLPDHAETRAILRESGLVLAAASANPEGRPPARNAEEALGYFEGRIDLVLDGGPAGDGPASTVAAPTETGARILREGAVDEATIRAICRFRIVFVGEADDPHAGMAAMIARHMLSARGFDAAVEAAGPGFDAADVAPTRSAREALHEMGYPTDDPARTALTAGVLDRADLLYVFTDETRRRIGEILPEAGQRVRVLRPPEPPTLPPGHPARRIAPPNYHEIAVMLERALWEPCKRIAAASGDEPA